MAKNIYLIRHGQSTFNLHFNATGIDPLHFDARLTDLGHEQAINARPSALELNVDLVVVSPLTRALQTATNLFEGSSVPITVSKLHQERQAFSCDIGSSPSVLLEEFPHLNFDHLADPWWYQGPLNEKGIAVEPDDVFKDRVEAFLKWTSARREESIAIVGHATFFKHLIGRFLNNCEIVKWDLPK